MRIPKQKIRIPLSEIRDEARRQARSLASKLLPQGQQKGNWWFAKVPWRNDKNASLGFSLTTTFYRDWGMPGDEGSVLDLVMKLDNCNLAQASDTLASLLGISGIEFKPRTKPSVLACRDCAHCWHRYGADKYHVSWKVTSEKEPIGFLPVRDYLVPDNIRSIAHGIIGDGYASARDERYCTAILFDEEPLATRIARRERWPCGPHAALFSNLIST